MTSPAVSNWRQYGFWRVTKWIEWQYWFYHLHLTVFTQSYCLLFAARLSHCISSYSFMVQYCSNPSLQWNKKERWKKIPTKPTWCNTARNRVGTVNGRRWKMSGTSCHILLTSKTGSQSWWRPQMLTERGLTILDWPPEFIGQSPSTNLSWSILRTVQSQVDYLNTNSSLIHILCKWDLKLVTDVAQTVKFSRLFH